MKIILYICFISIFTVGCQQKEKNNNDKLILALLLSNANSVNNSSSTSSDWSYSNPSQWSGSCQTGTKQSPINIVSNSAVVNSSASFNLYDTELHYEKVFNNGHSIETEAVKANSISIGGKDYKFKQLHVHTPSEHTVDGVAAEMEIHLVHTTDAGEVAVIGLLFNSGTENSWLSFVWQKLSGLTTKNSEIAISHSAKFSNILPIDNRYYSYEGSLTTPPCTESVKWFVYSSIIQQSSANISAIKKIIGSSARPTQNLNGRTTNVNK